MRQFGIVLLVLVWACGGGSTDTTAAGTAETTTTAVAEATTTEAETETVSVSEIPAACMEAFVDYLRTIEPVVEGFTADSSLEEFEAVSEELQPANETLEAANEANGCNNLNVSLDDEDSRRLLLELAEDEAPGTVGYLESILSFAGQFEGGGGGGSAVTGDCEKDIDAFMVWVDGDKNIQQLTIGEVTEVSALLAAIQTECPIDRWTALFEQADVAEFMSG